MYKLDKLKRKCRLSLDGDITIYHAAALHEALAAVLADPRPLEMDLSAVTEIDGAGVQLLMMVKRECQRLARPFTLVRHSDAVLDTFELAGLVPYFSGPAPAAGAQGAPREP